MKSAFQQGNSGRNILFVTYITAASSSLQQGRRGFAHPGCSNEHSQTLAPAGLPPPERSAHEAEEMRGTGEHGSRPNERSAPCRRRRARRRKKTAISSRARPQRGSAVRRAPHRGGRPPSRLWPPASCPPDALGYTVGRRNSACVRAPMRPGRPGPARSIRTWTDEDFTFFVQR